MEKNQDGKIKTQKATGGFSDPEDDAVFPCIWIDTKSIVVRDNNYPAFFEHVRRYVVETLNLRQPRFKIYYDRHTFVLPAEKIAELERLDSSVRFTSPKETTVLKSMLVAIGMWALHAHNRVKNPVVFVVSMDDKFDYLLSQLAMRKFQVFLCTQEERTKEGLVYTPDKTTEEGGARDWITYQVMDTFDVSKK